MRLHLTRPAGDFRLFGFALRDATDDEDNDQLTVPAGTTAVGDTMWLTNAATGVGQVVMRYHRWASDDAELDTDVPPAESLTMTWGLVKWALRTINREVPIDIRPEDLHAIALGMAVQPMVDDPPLLLTINAVVVYVNVQLAQPRWDVHGLVPCPAMFTTMVAMPQFVAGPSLHNCPPPTASRLHVPPACFLHSRFVPIPGTGAAVDSYEDIIVPVPAGFTVASPSSPSSSSSSSSPPTLDCYGRVIYGPVLRDTLTLAMAQCDVAPELTPRKWLRSRAALFVVPHAATGWLNSVLQDRRVVWITDMDELKATAWRMVSDADVVVVTARFLRSRAYRRHVAAVLENYQSAADVCKGFAQLLFEHETMTCPWSSSTSGGSPQERATTTGYAYVPAAEGIGRKRRRVTGSGSGGIGAEAGRLAAVCGGEYWSGGASTLTSVPPELLRQARRYFKQEGDGAKWMDAVPSVQPSDFDFDRNLACGVKGLRCALNSLTHPVALFLPVLEAFEFRAVCGVALDRTTGGLRRLEQMTSPCVVLTMSHLSVSEERMYSRWRAVLPRAVDALPSSNHTKFGFIYRYLRHEVLPSVGRSQPIWQVNTAPAVRTYDALQSWHRAAMGAGAYGSQLQRGDPRDDAVRVVDVGDIAHEVARIAYPAAFAADPGELAGGASASTPHSSSTGSSQHDDNSDDESEDVSDDDDEDDDLYTTTFSGGTWSSPDGAIEHFEDDAADDDDDADEHGAGDDDNKDGGEDEEAEEKGGEDDDDDDTTGNGNGDVGWRNNWTPGTPSSPPTAVGTATAATPSTKVQADADMARHAFMLQERVRGHLDGGLSKCSICTDSDECAFLECGHPFCVQCALDAVRVRKCSSCRKKLKTCRIVVAKHATQDDEDADVAALSAKMACFVDGAPECLVAKWRDGTYTALMFWLLARMAVAESQGTCAVVVTGDVEEARMIAKETARARHARHVHGRAVSGTAGTAPARATAIESSPDSSSSPSASPGSSAPTSSSPTRMPRVAIFSGSRRQRWRIFQDFTRGACHVVLPCRHIFAGGIFPDARHVVFYTEAASARHDWEEWQADAARLLAHSNMTATPTTAYTFSPPRSSSP